MRLTAKLAVLLGAVFCLTLCGALWFTYALQMRMLEERRDDAVLGAMARLADSCGADRGEGCERIQRILIENASPEAFLGGSWVSPGTTVPGDPMSPWDRGRGIAPAGPEPSIREDDSPLHGRVRIFTLPTGDAEALVWTYSRQGLSDSFAWVRTQGRRRLIQAWLLGTALAILLSVALASRLLAPLRAVAAASERVARGDFNARVPEGRTDELGLLASRFNRMAEQLSELDRLKDGFLAQVSHELRNPLNALVGKADTLLSGYKGELTPEQAEAVKVIAAAGAALAGIIDNMLDVTRLEAGRMKLEPSPLDVGSGLESCVERFSGRAGELGVSLTHEAPQDLAQALADPEAFDRVLSNLVSNALQFTPEKGSIRLSAASGEPGMIEIAVTDTGIGIPKECLPRLFTKFYQVPSTKNKVRPTVGAGLGLVLCKLLVEAQGGRILVESETFKGTRVRFTLKKAAPEESSTARSS
ncbi:MAG: HAMP domain-containing sensor histidine kinase [Elusimicrobiota bacterium]